MCVLSAGSGKWAAGNALFRQLELMTPREKWAVPYQLSDKAWDNLEVACHKVGAKEMIEFKKKSKARQGGGPWGGGKSGDKGGGRGRGRGRGRGN